MASCVAICPEVLGARLAACACHGRLTVAGVDIRPRRTHSKGWENDRPVQARSARGDTTPHRPTAQAPSDGASRDARPGHRAHSAQEPGRLARS